MLTLIFILFFIILRNSSKGILKLLPLFFHLFIMSNLLNLVLWRYFDKAVLNVPALIAPLGGEYTKNNLLSLLAILLILNFIQFFKWLENQKYLEKKIEIKRRRYLLFFASGVLIFIGILTYTSSLWVMETFNNVTFDQIVYLFSQPMTGADTSQIINYLVHPLLTSLFITSLIYSMLYYLCFYDLNFKLNKIFLFKDSIFVIVFTFSILVFGLGITLSIREIGFADIQAYYFDETKIYDEYYVHPKSVDYIFPEEKRNLIYIFLESMESSYSSQELGGSKKENLIPNLTNLALDQGIHFSQTEYLGGFLPLPGTNHTASSMVAQTAGVPLRTTGGTNLHVNNYGKEGEEFLPGAYSIGEILENEGYKQVLLMGSDATFAGRLKYFSQHGNYEIRDYQWAKEQQLIDTDYHVWWGYEDRKLFDYAKKTLTELSNQDNPFNFTMLTADTHFEDGYVEDSTPNLFNDQYSNVIHESDNQVMQLIAWIQEQPFYQNTTIVITGDHLTMDKDFFKSLDSDYQRSVYNVFINTGKIAEVKKNRHFSAVDMLPTTLAALNVEIPNNRVGLGVNLFSDEQTLIEELGYEEVKMELMKRSNFYERNLMKGSDLKIILNEQVK